MYDMDSSTVSCCEGHSVCGHHQEPIGHPPSPVQATDRSLIGRSAGSVWHAWLVLVSRSCLESSTETDSILAYRRLGNKLNNNVYYITFVLQL